MNYLFNILIMLLVIVPFGDAHAKNNKKIPPNTHPYIIEIKPTHKIKELLGVDISNDGRGIIKKQHIHRLFGAKNNLNKRKKRIEKKISLATSKKEQNRLKKRLKRIQKKITARKKMKKDGKLKYKEKVFILHVNNTIDEQIVLNALQQHPAIKSVSKSYQMKPMALPNDPFLNEEFPNLNDTFHTIRQGNQIESHVDRYASRELPKLWYLDTIQMNDVWKDFPEVTGEGVVVAVIDSGLQTNHEDIRDNLWTNPNPGDSSSTSAHFTHPNTYVNDINGWNYIHHNGDITDDASGHGSHVSGTIAAVGNNGKGLIGIAPNAKIMTLKIYDQGNSSNDYHILSALEYAINKGAEVINMSLGSSERKELSSEVNRYFKELFEEAKNEGIVITIAAGNSRSLFWIVKKTAFYSSSNPEIDRNTSEEIWNELNAKNIFDEYGRLKLEIDVSNDQLDLGLSNDNDAFKGHILNVLRNIRSNETRYEIPGEIFNDDPDNPKAYYPAWHAVNHENILTVAATTWSSDNTSNILKSPDWLMTNELLNEHLASFSNFSSRHITHERNNPIKVAAPGVTILSLKNSDATDQYIHKQGTSMATPIVAGLAALVIGINPDLTAKEVVDLIVNHTDKTEETDLAKSNYTGAGRINAYETISHALNSTVVMNPLDNHTIYTPTFNITGKTQQNTPVEIIKHSNNNIIGQGVSDDQGEFNITVTPNPTEYMTRRVFEIIASASITTNEITRQVQSKPLRLKYKIVDIQPELDTIESLITTPTLNITGTIMKGTPVTLVEQHGQSPQEFEPTIRQIMKGNKEQVTFQIQTKDSRNPIERKYKLKDTWGRLSNEITVLTNRNLPTITTPNTTIINSPFTLTGTASPNGTVQILSCSTSDCNLPVHINNATINSDGQFTSHIHYFDHDLGQTQFLIASATVLVNEQNETGIKTSNPKKIQFDLLDSRPKIISPINNKKINTNEFSIRGITAANTSVTLNKQSGTDTVFIDNNDSDESGYFEFKLMTPDQESETYTTKSTVHSKTYISPPVTLTFEKNENTPSITYPENNSIIHSNQYTLRGTAPRNSVVYLSRKTEKYIHGEKAPLLIKQPPILTKANDDGYWSQTIKGIRKDHGNYYTAQSQIDAQWLSSNEIRIMAKPNPNTPIITTPKNLETITTAYLPIQGKSAKNSVLTLTIFNDETLNSIITTKTATANHRGDWSASFKTLPNKDGYVITAADPHLIATSNSVVFHVDYDFNHQKLSINSSNSDVKTNKKNMVVSGQSPNGILSIELLRKDTADEFLPIKNWAIPITKKQWSINAPLDLNKNTHIGEYILNATITHNIKANEIITQNASLKIIRDSQPKIITPSKQRLDKNTIELTGTGKEYTTLTITLNKSSLTKQNKQLSAMNSNQNEILIGEVVTNKDGEWSLNVPIQANGSYQFNVYENYMQTNQTMQSLNIDIKLNQADVSLNLAPNPYNPKKGPLYIEYILNEPCRVDIGIYSIAGFKIDEKTFEHKQDGRHIIQWSLLPTPPPGLYVVVLKASGKKTVIKSKRLGVQW